MNANRINSAADVYQIVERLKAESSKLGLDDLTTELDNALRLGSSGLEILGAIRNIFIQKRAMVEKLLGDSGKDQAGQVITFVDKAFGR